MGRYVGLFNDFDEDTQRGFFLLAGILSFAEETVVRKALLLSRLQAKLGWPTCR